MNNTPEFLVYDEALTLQSVAEGKWDTCEQYLLDKLVDYGYIRKTESEFEPTIILFDGRTSNEYLSEFTDAEKNSL